jgi:hypothetical protein
MEMNKMKPERVRYIKLPEVEQPVWKKIIVESDLPESLSPLRELSRNMWWYGILKRGNIPVYRSRNLGRMRSQPNRSFGRGQFQTFQGIGAR